MKRYFKKEWVVLVLALVVTVGLVQFLNGGLRFSGHSQHVAVTELTASNLQQEISSAKGPVYVEFYSTNSADSKAELVILDDAAQHYDGQAKFFSVNIDEQPEVAAAFAGVVSQAVGQQLKSLPPTVHVMVKFDDQGNAQLMNVGAGLLPEQYLAKFIDDGLTGKALQNAQGAQQQGGQPDTNNGGGNGSNSGTSNGGANGGTDSTGAMPAPTPQKLAPTQAPAPANKAQSNKTNLVAPTPKSDAVNVPLPGAKP